MRLLVGASILEVVVVMLLSRQFIVRCTFRYVMKVPRLWILKGMGEGINYLNRRGELTTLTYRPFKWRAFDARSVSSRCCNEVLLCRDELIRLEEADALWPALLLLGIVSRSWALLEKAFWEVRGWRLVLRQTKRNNAKCCNLIILSNAPHLPWFALCFTPLHSLVLPRSFRVTRIRLKVRVSEESQSFRRIPFALWLFLLHGHPGRLEGLLAIESVVHGSCSRGGGR